MRKRPPNNVRQGHGATGSLRQNGRLEQPIWSHSSTRCQIWDCTLASARMRTRVGTRHRFPKMAQPRDRGEALLDTRRVHGLWAMAWRQR